MKLTITEPYLWFPVDMSGEPVCISVYDGEQKVQEMKVALGKEKVDFYGAWKVTEFIGKELGITCAEGEEQLQGCPIRQEAHRPENAYPYRPRLHYTPAYGWVNDPNGLFYADGVYHVYHQYNPYSTEWENMSWGYATSTDLMHWEEHDVAVTPDEYGAAYSGCAFVDHKNAAGYGKDAVLFFYTAAGGRNEWSKEAGNRFTQKLMWSTDGGKSIHKRPEPLIPWMVDENRDPKVFWHEASNAYIMIMYLAENEFLILRSTDLLHWEETQRMTVPGMWECPLLMELSVDGTDEKKWVFWSADGYYQIGNFDGYTFRSETERKMAYFSRRAYAAQNFANVEGRVLLLPWIRLDNANGWYRSAMGIPQEICLKEGRDGLQMAFAMAKELKDLRVCQEILPVNETAAIAGEARELQMIWPAGTTGIAALTIGETTVELDFTNGVLSVDTPRKQALETEVRGSFDPAHAFDLTVVIDQEMIDILADGGRLCGTIETEENVLGKTLRLQTNAAPEQSMWWVLR